MKKFLNESLVLFTVFALCLGPAFAMGQELDRHKEYRYCGEPVRDLYGQIARDRAVLASFQKLHPCPSTGLRVGACAGWAIDHVIPLACGGCDSVANLQWLPNVIKSAPGTLAKDRWERRICSGQIVTMPEN